MASRKFLVETIHFVSNTTNDQSMWYVRTKRGTIYAISIYAGDWFNDTLRHYIIPKEKRMGIMHGSFLRYYYIESMKKISKKELAQQLLLG
jgi:hypothetical protein